MRKKSALAALFVSAALIAGACGGGGASIVGSYKPGEGGTGGTLLVGDYQDVDSLHPYYYGTVMSANVLATTWDGLVTLTNEAKYVPWMATEIPTVANGGIALPGVNGDAMTVTWKLREGLVWSDGKPITCADAEYTHSWVMTEGNPLSTVGAQEISDVECVDDLTIVLHYSELYSGVYGGVGIMPKHYFEKYDINSGNPATDMVLGAGFRDEDLPNVPVSGPFKYASRTPLVETAMVRNDKWKNPYSGEGTKLDGIKYVVCGDPDTCIAKFRAGELDIVTDLDGNNYASTVDLGAEQKTQSTFTYEFFRPNHSSDDCSILEPLKTTRGGGCPVSDPAIRKAIAQATDKEAILSRVLGGAGIVATSSITPDAWFFKAGTPVSFDLAAAKKTLTDAGWVDSNGDGVVEKDGVSAILEFCTTGKPSRKSTIAYVAGDLAKIGIKAVYNGSSATIFEGWTDSTEDMSCNLARGTFDVALHAFSSGIEAVGLYGSYHSTQFEPDGYNDAKVNDPAIDAELDIIKDTIDLDVILASAHKVQDIFAATTVEIPLYYWMGLELVSNRVGGFLQNPTLAGPLWNAGDLTLAP